MIWQMRRRREKAFSKAPPAESMYAELACETPKGTGGMIHDWLTTPAVFGKRDSKIFFVPGTYSIH